MGAGERPPEAGLQTAVRAPLSARLRPCCGPPGLSAFEPLTQSLAFSAERSETLSTPARSRRSSCAVLRRPRGGSGMTR